jgi:hypothetical protein
MYISDKYWVVNPAPGESPGDRLKHFWEYLIALDIFKEDVVSPSYPPEEVAERWVELDHLEASVHTDMARFLLSTQLSRGEVNAIQLETRMCQDNGCMLSWQACELESTDRMLEDSIEHVARCMDW